MDMELAAIQIQNDRDFVPLAATGAPVLLLADSETFLIVSRTLRSREGYGKRLAWLSDSSRYVSVQPR